MTPRRESEIRNWYVLAARMNKEKQSELTVDLFRALTSLLDDCFGTLNSYRLKIPDKSLDDLITEVERIDSEWV